MFKPDVLWSQLNTQKGRDTKCSLANSMPYASCPVSHRYTKCICIYKTWYVWLHVSQGHSAVFVRSRSHLPSLLQLAGNCAHSLAHTPLEGGNTLQTHKGPLKLLVEHGKVFQDLNSVLQYPFPYTFFLKNLVLCFYSYSVVPAKYYLLHSSFSRY